MRWVCTRATHPHTHHPGWKTHLDTIPILPALWMYPGMMPIFTFSPGQMIPGQLGPINRVLLCMRSADLTRTMSCCGMPSVIATTNPISASIASMIAPAAWGGGTNTHDALAPACFTASPTSLKMGRSKCLDPAFFGLVPPTTCVPYAIACSAWNVPCFPVNPWNTTLVCCGGGEGQGW